MPPLIDDGSLVLFSPLNEPSGVPTFANLAPRYISAAISYDWHPMIAGTSYTNEVLSLHPGGSFVFHAPSGTTVIGYCAQGNADLGVQTSDPANKALAWGVGQSDVRGLMAPPNVANSGFTVGLWVYPTSDGAWESDKNDSNEINAERHLLLGRGNAADGFVLGVSGLLIQDARDTPAGSEDGLTAFLHVKQNMVHLETPIERNRYTHLTFTYRFVDSTVNEFVLYKDGRVASSGTSTEELGSANTSYADRVLSIGGSQDASSVADGIEFPTGWGHLVSGVYGFDRVLHEGEVAGMHDDGGLQVGGRFEGVAVSLEDPTLVAYVPLIEPAFVDVSPNHNNFHSDRDLGVDGRLTICPGPFNRVLAFKDDTSDDIAIATGSGVINAVLAGNGSFSIGGWFYIRGLQGVGDHDANTLMSLGSIGTSELTPTRFTGGFHVSTSGSTNTHRITARIYEGGMVIDEERTATITSADDDIWAGVLHHVALVYDAQTRGIAFYVDKRQAGSGNMDSPFEDVVTRLAGSGYPFVFLNGVVQDTVDNFSTVAGNDCAAGEMFVFSKPLEPQEIISIAESGIDITPLYYTRHDPRLRGYWPGTDQITNDFNFPDEAFSMKGQGVPGNMTKALTDQQWDVVTSFIDSTQHSEVDLLSVSRGSQGGVDDVYDGSLGFTSGSFVVMGGSLGFFNNNTAGVNKRTSSVTNPFRYRPVAEDRDIYSQHIINQYVIAFDVTPSGNIPATADGHTDILNSNLVVWGENQSNDRLISYLTTEDGAGSGIVIRFDSRDGAVQQNLIQASLPFGFPSRVGFVARSVTPYNADSHGDNHTELSIYVDGQLTNVVQHVSSAANMWSNNGLNSLTSIDWILSIGGRPAHDAFATHMVVDGGLGEIHLRNISVWIGALSDDDIAHIVTSGVRASSLSEYSDSVDITSVDTADADLKGYWRFAGESPQSGVFDSSIAGNNLTNLAQQKQDQIGGPGWTNPNNTSDLIRFVPGPFINTSLGLRGSGLTYASSAPNASNVIAPMAASGTDFESPNTGFTFGLWVCPREATPSTTKMLVSYGPVPTSTLSTAWVDASWAIGINEVSDIVCFLSQDGRMPTDTASSTDLVVKCPMIRSIFAPSDSFNVHREGTYGGAHLDALSHIIFSYDAATDILKGYLNGELVTQAAVPASGFHTPLSVDARILSFLTPQQGAPWSYGIAMDDPNAIIFDPFYMSRALTDAEARYIATQGIAAAVTTLVSGVIGGYMPTSEQGTGVIGGYIKPLDHGSGVIGGFMEATDARDGTIGGYLPTLDHGSGIVGAYMPTSDHGSGIVGGFLLPSDFGSGIIGGFLVAGFQGNVQFDSSFVVKAITTSDFDASITVVQSNNASFDAQIIVFRSDEPPVVDIIVPPITTSGEQVPFSQYFVGEAIAASGKTIDSAFFSFSDFGGTVAIPESGNGLFAVTEDHVFQASGIMIVRFSVIDSAGLHSSATRIIHLASGISPVEISLSGIPDVGVAPVLTQFDQKEESVPVGVSIVAELLDFDDGTSTISRNVIHSYTEPGLYRPVWLVRDSRGFLFSDSLHIGVNT